MDLLPTEEQQQIIDSAAGFLEKEYPVSQIVVAPDNTPLLTREQLKAFAELGWLGISLEEEKGGVGYSLSEEVLLFIEMGRNLVSPCVLASVLATRLAALTTQDALCQDILSGASIVALATSRRGPQSQISDTISGDFFIYDGREADLILLVDEKGAALIDKTTLSCDETGRCIDGKLPLSTFTANEAPALAYISKEADNLYLRGSLLLSAMFLGIAEATKDRCVDYAKVREQFGKPIGSFQAVKHACANMAINCESVRALLSHACITQQKNRADGAFDTFAIRALSAEAAEENANKAVQLHGGMGFTEELDIHLFVKRAQVLDTFFGSRQKHLKNLLAEAAPEL